MAEDNKMCQDLLGQLEKSYRDKRGYWKHGGIVGVMGYGGGVIGRYSFLAEEFPNVAHFHTFRINQPAGWFYTSDAIRTLCDIWERHGSGLTNMHGSTGDIVFLGTVDARARADLRRADAARLRPGRLRLRHAHAELLRGPGPLRMGLLRHDGPLRRPDADTSRTSCTGRRSPTSSRFKCSGCPNDCVASIARSDMSIIGTWRDDIQIDQAEVKDYADGGLDIQKDVCGNCPTKCMEWDGKQA